MGIASDLKTLGEDIVTSFDMRVNAIGQLVKDTHKMLRGFDREHKEMSTKLRGDLAKGEEDRLSIFKDLMANIQKFISNLVKEVSTMLRNFDKEHKAMADDLRKRLSAGEADRLKISKALMADIQEFISGLEKGVSAMLKNFDKEHEAMADDLRQRLAEGETDRLKFFRSMMRGIHGGIKEIETFVANKLKEFHEEHAEMSEELKKFLARYVTDMIKATKRLMSDIQKQQDERNKEVADMLTGYHIEMGKASTNWQELTAKMAKRRGAKPLVSAGAEVTTVEEAVAKKPKRKTTAKKKKTTARKRKKGGK